MRHRSLFYLRSRFVDVGHILIDPNLDVANHFEEFRLLTRQCEQQVEQNRPCNYGFLVLKVLSPPITVEKCAAHQGIYFTLPGVCDSIDRPRNYRCILFAIGMLGGLPEDSRLTVVLDEVAII